MMQKVKRTQKDINNKTNRKKTTSSSLNMLKEKARMNSFSRKDYRKFKREKEKKE